MLETAQLMVALGFSPLQRMVVSGIALLISLSALFTLLVSRASAALRRFEDAHDIDGSPGPAPDRHLAELAALGIVPGERPRLPALHGGRSTAAGVPALPRAHARLVGRTTPVEPWLAGSVVPAPRGRLIAQPKGFGASRRRA